jgi:hypothetical protein
MQNAKPLSDFFDAISNDAHISIAHIGLYAVLLIAGRHKNVKNTVIAFSHELIKRAKISTRATYLKCMQDLNNGGYVRYKPTFNRNRRSKIYLLTSNNQY